MIWTPIIYMVLVVFALHLAQRAEHDSLVWTDEAQLYASEVEFGVQSSARFYERASRSAQATHKLSVLMRRVAGVLAVVGVIHTLGQVFG